MMVWVIVLMILWYVSDDDFSGDHNDYIVVMSMIPVIIIMIQL